MSGQPARRIAVEDVGDVSVVTFAVRRLLDEQTIQTLGDELFRLVDERGRQKVLLDLSDVEFLSSASLGKLVTLQRKLQAVQGKLRLGKIAPDMLDIFQTIKLDRYFTILTDPALVSTDDLIGAAFGNPYPASAFSADWRTDTVLALARQMSAAGDFSAMPILADALQDAGCADEALLALCRAAALTPARARWLLERVAGRE